MVGNERIRAAEHSANLDEIVLTVPDGRVQIVIIKMITCFRGASLLSVLF